MLVSVVNNVCIPINIKLKELGGALGDILKNGCGGDYRLDFRRSLVSGLPSQSFPEQRLVLKHKETKGILDAGIKACNPNRNCNISYGL